jgi:hypothetical protein
MDPDQSSFASQEQEGVCTCPVGLQGRAEESASEAAAAATSLDQVRSRRSHPWYESEAIRGSGLV